MSELRDYYEALFKDAAHPLYHYSLDYQNPSNFSCGCPMEPFFCKVTDHMDVVAYEKYQEHRRVCPVERVDPRQKDN